MCHVIRARALIRRLDTYSRKYGARRHMTDLRLKNLPTRDGSFETGLDYMPSINFSRTLCETSDLIKCTVCKENIDSMQENINGMHVHILLLNVFWTLVVKNDTSKHFLLCVGFGFNDKVGLSDYLSSQTVGLRP